MLSLQPALIECPWKKVTWPQGLVSIMLKVKCRAAHTFSYAPSPLMVKVF